MKDTPKNQTRQRLAVAALACILTQSTAQAGLMAYEGFNYSTGSGNVPGLNGGFGWKGAWQSVVNGASSIAGGSLTAGANAPTGYDARSAGNAISTPNGTRTGRSLDTSAGGAFGVKGFINGNGYIGAAGKTIYISFLQQPNIANNNYYEFEFHRGSLNDPGRIGGVGCDTGGSSSVFLRTPTAGQTLIGPASTTASLYVVRIDFAGGNDTVTVYQNPTSATEPATATLVETGAGDMSFDGLSCAAFVNGATVTHDEIRVGETWSDVVSPGLYSTGRWAGGAGGSWSAGGNWDNGVVPVFPSSLTFAGSTGLNNNNDLTGIAANGITFDAAAGAFTLAGNSLGLNGNLKFSANPGSPITQTINLPLVPSQDITIDTPTNGNIVLGGDITSTSWLTKTGNGTLTLGGNATFGAVSASGGTNIITGTTTFNGQGGGHKFYIADGPFISQCKNTVILQPNATLSVIGSYGDAGVIGRDSGSGTFIQNGGTFNFNPANQVYLFIGASGNTATHSEYDMKGGLFDMNSKTLGIALGANAAITCTLNQTGGVITNVDTLYFSPFFTQGHGIYNLSGGTLYLGIGGIIVYSGGGYELNLGGGTIAAQGSWSSALNMNLTGSNGPVTFNPQGNTITLTGTLSGSGGLRMDGAGTLELSGPNTYTGDTTVTAGSTLQLDVTGSSAGAYRLANGATLNLNFSGTYVIGGLYTNGVAVPTGTYASGSLGNFLTGSGNLQVTSGISTGLWKGSGANNNWSTAANWDNNAVPVFPHALTFAGNTRLNNNNDLSGITVSTLTFDSAAGAFTLGGNDLTVTGSIGFNGTPASPITQTVSLGLTFNANQTFAVPANATLNLGGSINSGYNLIKTGAGTLTLGGASDTFATFSVNGGTNIITGNVNVSASGNSKFYVGDSGTTGTLIIQPGAMLNVSGYFGDAGVLGRDSGSGYIIQNGGTFSFNPGNVAYLFIGASSSAATHAQYDMNGGVLDMNNYTFAVALSANSSTLLTCAVNQTGGSITNVGKLDLGAFTFGPGRGIYNQTGGSLYIGANGIQTDSGLYEIYLGGGTVGAVSGWSSPLNMMLTGTNGAATFDTAGNTITLTGILSGHGGFKVIGGGVLELGGANTQSGDITINNGTLQLDVAGSCAGALRIIDGGLLNLNFGGNYVVGGLYTNGVQLPYGTYTAASLPSFIAGSGNLVVQGVSIGQWTGQGGNGNWSTAGNWDHNALPIFPIGLTFVGASRLNNTNDLDSITANSITFDAAASAFTLYGNSLTLNGNIAFTANPATPVTQTVNLPLAPSANLNVDTPAKASLVVNGGISAANNTVYKVGNGQLTLNGNNALAGFDADGGTTVITGNTTITGTGSSRTYIANGDYLAGATGTLNIQSGATFTVTGPFADAYVVGRDGGAGTLNQNGGTFNFAIGNNNYLFVAAGNNPNTKGAYNMNAGLLDMNGNTLGIGLGAEGAAVTGVMNQTGGIVTNVGTLILGYNYGQIGHGIYNMTGGSLYLGANGIQSQTGSYELFVGGGTIGAQASWSTSMDIVLSGTNGAATFNPGGNTITLSGAVSGAGGLTAAGGGVLELSGTATFTGETMVGAGTTLRLDSAPTTSAAFRLSNATAQLNYTGTGTTGALYTNGIALPKGTYSAANLPAFILGSGSLMVAGSVPTTATNLSYSISGGTINLSWPASYKGWILQRQSNPLAIGLSNNWADVPGTASLTATNIPVDAATPTVFYRLRYPTP
jgi:autotransporter-associated beta strand protein